MSDELGALPLRYDLSEIKTRLELIAVTIAAAREQKADELETLDRLFKCKHLVSRRHLRDRTAAPRAGLCQTDHRAFASSCPKAAIPTAAEMATSS
jgi:hypothetical protein